MAAIWRSRPVFVSSTFRDMHAERDWLRSRVFPALEERLKARFHYLETIDLRWGVDTMSLEQEGDRELAVLSVCLNEIERSRPFLIGLLGDRYGWRPSPAHIARAAREAGLAEEVSGKSVTELEILHGVLRSPGQQHRSWFYFREPLDYDEMPPAVAARYSDRHSGEPDAAERADKLASLKQELATALPGRVRSYRAGWDAGRQALMEADLEVWGAQVLDDLWSDLEAETADFLRAAPTTWQEQDRWALDEFVEGRTRGFVGRTKVTDDLIGLATSPAEEGASWGTCVTAETGCGKSSLFGHLSRSLQKLDVLVLAHAAGISVRSTQVDWMLRRWVGELASALGEADPLAEGATPDEIDQAFSRLLNQASQTRRVVVLLDALNQFEPTTRATHLTWLPRLWPPNARLVATAIVGTQSQALCQRPGTTETPLAPVDEGSALAIVRGLCSRYHRTLNARVETALLGKRTPAGESAFGNPLWLAIATEELNLLDAQAFDRAEADSSLASGGDAVVGLLLSTVEQMPGDVEGLYGFMLDRTERQFGQAWTRAFVNAIGVSRAGWRESDLETLMPRLSGGAWDPLRFATLRRGLRVHVVQRGSHAQWDFTHAQMRTAITLRLAREKVDATGLHSEIGRYLLGLNREDPLHETETMVHLMQTSDLRPAARFYGGTLTSGEAKGATEALKTLLIEGRAHLVTALSDQDVEPALKGSIAESFVSPLNDAIENEATLDVRRLLQETGKRILSDLIATEPDSTRWQRDLAVTHNKLGIVLTAQGFLGQAGTAFQASLAAAERLAAADPGDAGRQRDLAASHNHLGNVLTAQGNLPGALTAFQTALAITQRLVAADPVNADWQRNLAINFGCISDVLKAQGNLSGALGACRTSLAVRERLAAADPGNTDWQGDLAVSHERLGHVLMSQGNLVGALAAFQNSCAIAERLAATDPSNISWQSVLAVSHNHIGDVLSAQGDLPGALAVFRANVEVQVRLAAADPDNVQRQHDLAITHLKLGDVLTAQGNLPGALDAVEASLAIVERVAANDPSNADAQRDLAHGHERVGHVLMAQGHLTAAVASFQASHAIAERLAAADPSNAERRRDLSVSHAHLGEVLFAQGHLSHALVAFRASHDIAERLAAADPANTDWQRDLAISHAQLGNLLTAQLDLDGALAAFQAGLAIADGLAPDPRDAGWQRRLALSSVKLGDLLRAQGNLSASLASFQHSLSLVERLAAADPTNTESQGLLAVIHGRLGDELTAQGDLTGALDAFRASLAITEGLAASDSSWLSDLAGMHTKVGDALNAQGHLSAALEAFQTGLAIAERLAATDPRNTDWQRSLSVSHERLGDALRVQGHTADALAAFRAGLAITERLAATEPANTEWQRDLEIGHSKLGDVLRDQGQMTGALDALRSSLAIAERLAATDPGNAEWQRDLALSHNRLGDALSVEGQVSGAFAAFQASLAIRERLAAADPGNAAWQRDLVVSNYNLARLLQLAEDAGRPLVEILDILGEPVVTDYWRRCHTVLRRMKGAGMFLDPPLVQLLEQLDGTDRS